VHSSNSTPELSGYLQTLANDVNHANGKTQPVFSSTLSLATNTRTWQGTECLEDTGLESAAMSDVYNIQSDSYTTLSNISTEGDAVVNLRNFNRRQSVDGFVDVTQQEPTDKLDDIKYKPCDVQITVQLYDLADDTSSIEANHTQTISKTDSVPLLRRRPSISDKQKRPILRYSI